MYRYIRWQAIKIKQEVTNKVNKNGDETDFYITSRLLDASIGNVGENMIFDCLGLTYKFFFSFFPGKILLSSFLR